LGVDLESWIVGFCEGEGSFVLNNGRNPHFTLSNTDEKAVRTVAKFFAQRGVEGHLYGPYPRRGTQTKTSMEYRVTKGSECHKMWGFFKRRLQTPFKKTQLAQWDAYFADWPLNW
jgi:hypothetical protein